jgi:BlaI family transcriptional regulator, penicillinase repressor
MKATQLGRMQLRIMQVLWSHRRATAREITDALNEAETVAHSTVQTLLRGLEDKRAVAHQADGRTFVFFPLVEEDNYRSTATRDLLHRVFAGNVEDLVAHLLKHEQVSPEELSQIRRLVDRHGKKDKKE